MKIIGKKDDMFLVSYSDKLNLSYVHDFGFIVRNNGQYVSPILPLGVLMKEGYWKKFDGEYNNYILNDGNYILNSLIGAAVGDAFGVPYEFMSRNAISKLILKDMVGSDVGHDFNSYWGNRIPSGSWSDDTSMIIATMISIIENKKIDYTDIMEKFTLWSNKNLYSSNDFSFGEGSIVSEALKKYASGINPINCGGTKVMDNGNGSLMRILPFSLYCIVNNLNDKEMYDIIAKGSSLTHGNEISIMACYMYTKLLSGAIKTRNIHLALNELINSDYKSYFNKDTILEYSDILNNTYELKADDIDESGYVVDSLKAVVYSLVNTNSYSSAIKKCIKLGYDTDTNACITGAVAGIIYGIEDIPDNWKKTLKKRDYLTQIAFEFQKTITDVKIKENNETKKAK